MNRSKHVLNDEFECRVKSVVPKASHVVFINQKQYTAGNERYFVGTMRNPNWQYGGFIKLTRSDGPSGVELSRESRATELAGLLGIQSVQIHQRYIDIGDGYGMVIFERLSKVCHRMFSGKSELTGVGSSIGTRAAKVFVSDALIPIPTSTDTSFLNRNDPRLVGSHSFIEMWQDNTRRLFSGRLLNSQLRGGDNTKNIKRVIEDIRRTIIDTIEHQDGDSHKKFVHGDYAPTNLAFHKRRLHISVPDVTVLDFG